MTEQERKQKAKEIIEFQVRYLKDTYKGNYYKAKEEYYGCTYWIISTIRDLEIINYQEYCNYKDECENFIKDMIPF